MPTFPVDLKGYLDCFPLEQQAFDLGEGNLVQNRTAGGEVLRSAGGVRLWRGSITLTAMRHEDARAMQARLHVLRGAGAVFYVSDLFHPGPNISATLATVQSNGTINISGGPPNATFGRDDYVSFTYGGRRALHQIVDSPAGYTLNASGVRNGIEVVPPIRPGWTAGTAVTIGAGTCLAVMDPGGVTVGTTNRVATLSATLNWTQTLRPVT